MAKGKQSKHRRNRKSKRTYGGSDGATGHGMVTYGTNQTSMPGNGNLISMTSQTGGEQQQQQQQQCGKQQQQQQQGGKQQQQQQQQGGKQQQQQQQAGNVMMDIAVPAVLVTANHLYKRQGVPMNFMQSRKFRKSRKFRGSRRSRRFRRR